MGISQEKIKNDPLDEVLMEPYCHYDNSLPVGCLKLDTLSVTLLLNSPSEHCFDLSHVHLLEFLHPSMLTNDVTFWY
jgi:hypothetical protein